MVWPGSTSKAGLLASARGMERQENPRNQGFEALGPILPSSCVQDYKRETNRKERMMTVKLYSWVYEVKSHQVKSNRSDM